ncbi:putative inactive leucine-rich repeat receptor-like protein kinase [Raphanus sativus]|uniref:Probably inactive leucine-rich repeat receptor-like protein kinase At3g28040 n=1 Tax=Raphanus sativus TaxID=3726 RepID=A0A6J0LBI5_RAPSA|nr:probably inactive leucine-rich repeat receptor-like protein kinase At3g28040 [Raphanus sativus]KAJ4877861.1 putative inactive leucine-rich repeat receptor-like protein kinase [Raphanus sativus]
MGDHKRKAISVTLLLALTMISLINGDINSIQLNDDVLGLIVFKSDLHDPSSHLASWNEDDVSPCSWSYVKCNPKTSRVTELSLSGLGLTGKIGRGIQKLQHLQTLSLSNNNFTGTITSLSNNNNLHKLDLSHNNLSGTIPSSLRSTRYLDLTGNSFSGTLSDGLFTNCSSLTYLSLSQNHLEGELPSTLFRCSVLNSLNLSSNRFSGNPSFESGLWKLERLRTLDLSFNALSGALPLGIHSLHSLKVLQLQGNQFSGSLPSDIGLCPHLNRVDLSFNRFSGELPTTLQRLKSLNHLGLSNNLLSGGFPVWIGDITSLLHLDFSKNELTGVLPSSVGNLRSLKDLILSENKLSGEIPESLESCKELVSVQLKGNGFVGSIPGGLFNLGLQEMDFSGNGLTGSIPRGSNRLFESLVTLDLSCNSLSGNIPGEVGLFSNLRHLNLSWNNFNTRVPPEIEFLRNLTVLDLRNNSLIGSVPADICESQSLEILQLDGNSLTGSIPEGIGNCSSLESLSLSHNNLTGLIPKSLSKLQDLKILKLEANKLSGEIPKELGGLHNLLLVNISFNRLIGRLPNGDVFQRLDQSALQGNLGICSPLLKGPCKMNVSKPIVIDPNSYGNRNNNEGRHGNLSSNGSSKYHNGMFLSVSVVVAISAAILIFLGVIIVTLLNASVRRKLVFVDNALESIFSGSSRSGRSLVAGKLIMLNSRTSLRSSSSSQEFARNPESHLNKASRIGEGVFGTVYKAPLGEQGSNVAVKKLVPSPVIENLEDFDREVRILAKAKHPNLGLIKGYYWTPDMQLLVSEYFPNGNLQSKLHEREPSTPPLSWEARFRIILGTAKGLAYLHHTFRPTTVHFNLKPTNILLDEKYNPKVSDFGLSRLITQDGNTMNNNRFKNALGYVAPELECQNLRVNEKCDVYGFGVLILELVTGRRPVEYGEDSFVILSDQVKVMLEQGNVLECIDPAMEEEYSEDEVLPVVKLALVCTSQIPSNRPTMAEIVQILQVITSPVPHRMLDSF